MEQRNQGGVGVMACAVMLFCAAIPERARGQAAQDAQPQGGNVVEHPLGTKTGGSSDESLTVLGHTHKFQPAPMPGPPIGPPPEKPAPHLGRYKISGDQTKKDGYDTQTGAYIAPFGSAYTNAGPVSDGLASRFQH
ncbi:hypothetical protein NFI95_01475 [Acetobacteraceae bacterium KSS8]|uniref:Uncharacterized protein n=1 Tax=Endosaccharibacter trunci TaxID=2812733 RepID=A0ABT1W2M3_9PROT|nr:hypothetical protein [Acetobacteraceae bacterium KSS8]